MMDHHHRTMVTDLHHLRVPHHHSTWGQVRVRTATAWVHSRREATAEVVAAPTSNSRTLLHSREEEQLPAQPLLTSRDHTRTIHRLLQSLLTQPRRQVTTAEEDLAAGVRLLTGPRAVHLQVLREAAVRLAAARNRRC